MTRRMTGMWVVVALAALVVFGWRMNTLPLTNWDEGIYANVNLELFQSHDWSKLTYFGKQFLEKPPLQFWLTYVTYGIFGPTEFAVRFWSVLAGVGVALMLTLWSWQLWHRRWFSIMAGLLFVGGRFALIHAFRTGDLDGLLTLWIVIALYGYWRAGRDAPRWIVVWGAASAAAIMTKSLAGIVPLAVVAVDMLLTRGWRKIGWGNIAWAIAIFIALVTPWHIVESLRFGPAFWREYLGWNIVQRSTDSLFTTTPWWYYLSVFFDRFFPWSYLLPLGGLLALIQYRRTWPAHHRLFVLWALFVGLMYTAIQTRREWYILPLYPPVILLQVGMFRDWWTRTWSRWFLIGLVANLAVIFAAVLADQHFMSLVRHVPFAATFDSGFWTTGIGRLGFGVGVALAIFGVSSVLSRRWPLARRLFLLAGSGLALMTLVWTAQYLRSLPTTLPLKTIAARINRERLPKVELIGTKLKKQPAGYFYILRLDTTTTEEPAGTLPKTPVILTTAGAENSPLNTEGRILLRAGSFVLVDFR